MATQYEWGPATWVAAVSAALIGFADLAVSLALLVMAWKNAQNIQALQEKVTDRVDRLVQEAEAKAKLEGYQMGLGIRHFPPSGPPGG
jgi:hypothetical protein